jgi:hypothetical protein
MAKKQIRVASVNEKIAALIDRGSEIDETQKNLTVEEKGIKKILGDEAEKLLEKDETSVKLSGNKALASIVATEKYELNASHDLFPLADAAIKTGAFSDAVRVVKSLAIPPEKVEEAAKLLKKAGLNVMLQVNYDIDPKEFRVLMGSRQSTDELQKVVDALRQCSVRKTTMRVSYEAKES